MSPGRARGECQIILGKCAKNGRRNGEVEHLNRLVFRLHNQRRESIAGLGGSLANGGGLPISNAVSVVTGGAEIRPDGRSDSFHRMTRAAAVDAANGVRKQIPSEL